MASRRTDRIKPPIMVLSERGRFRLIMALTGCLIAAIWLAAAPPQALAACGNPVQCENQLAGDPPSDWEVNGIGDSTIQGYATQFSVNAGQTESFKISTPSTSYHIDILRLGYYGGNGARKIAATLKPTASLPQTQPACQTFSATGLIDCGNWSVSASWTVPSTAVSGVYIAHLVRDDAQDRGGDSQIPFVVRNDASHSDIVLSTSDATWQAYNDYGGNSLYTCTVACPPGNPLGYKAAYSVSYNRPFDGTFQTDAGQSYVYYAEYQMIRFLEENGYDVSYVSDSDLDSSGSLILNHKLFVSSAHDEYWSGNEVGNIKAALAAGVNLGFFSGNEVFWKTRWGPSQDGSNTPNRTLTTYKETHFNAPTDPNDPPTWTGAWADPRFSPPADGGYPANALTGQEFLVNAGSGDLTVPSQYSKLRFWRNTAVATLASGTSLTLAKGNSTLGYEWDADVDNGWRPAGEFDLSSTTLTGVQPFIDYGSTTGTAAETHHLSLYRAPSGALVFGAGTVQWAWGIDDTNAWSSAGPPASTPDRNMQQATVNLFADMGIQPTTLLSGLTPAAGSTDTTPPSSSLTSPSAGANIQDGSQVAISGSATDAGGGVVAGVEVSTNGGKSWHPATLGTPAQPNVTWTYTWIAHGNPSGTIETRAVDDSGNLEAPSDAISVSVGCPCSMWGTSVTPATAVPGDPNSVNDSGDGASVTVGVKFTSDTFGQVSGIRFYKATANTGTHIGTIWSATGQQLATATFTNESASGWQTVTFSNPVTVLPNTTYVAGYFAPKGHYSATDDYFFNAPAPTPLGGSTLDSGPLHTPANTSTANGLYTYGAASTFPANASEGSNYWVDVMFAPSPAPDQVTGVHATAGSGAVFVTWNPPSTGGPPTAYTITPYAGPTPLTPTVVTGTPPPTGTAITGLASGSSYTFTVTASNPVGAGPASAASNAVAPTAATGTPSFVQQVTAHGAGPSLSVTPASDLTVGNRVIVLAGVWSGGNATAGSVTDSAGDQYVELGHWAASEHTEMSVWSAPIWPGGGTRPTITVTPTSSADVGIAASEYSGLSPVNDTSVVDQVARATGTTSGAVTVSSGATAAAAAANELALGVYVDSGFGDTLTAGSGWTQRSNVSNAADMELLSEDQVSTAAGSKPNASVGTGPSTVWQVGTLVLKGAPAAAPSAPGSPTGVSATAGDGEATVSWTAPPDNGSPITSYTITPYIGNEPQLPSVITGSPPTNSTTITGLTNGTSYTFTVVANNLIGAGHPSGASNAVTPTAPTPPGTASSVTATAGDSKATVSWTAPSNGGSPITSYTVTPYIGTQPQTPTTVAGSPPSTSATIAGLINGTTYTFTVSATNAVGTGPASAPSNTATPSGPTAPGAPTGVSATAGLNNATVKWTAPSSGGSPISSYTITPFIGAAPQTPTTITGSPPSNSSTVSNLTNGTAYTFTVSAANAVGTGPASDPSNSVTPSAATAPTFVQQVSSHKLNATTVAVVPPGNVTAGNRIVVLVGVWSSAKATAKSVTDAAGNSYVEVQHFKASENTELSVWTAPITAGGGTKPTITVTPSAKADVGAAALEYSGLSTAAGLAAIDQTAQNTGTTGAAGTVSSGATPAATAAGELALGFYTDSGFNDTLTAGTGWTQRVNVSKVSDMELLVEEQASGLGATPNASAGTGASTTWEMSTLLFKHG